ncbi:hypothetical protein ATY41_01640 [Leifsonia xyli subsp. xyli]|uniref:Uncharacterized protein n=1 Tax=Leifsonia xyli subsp. xyli TaxID=59736 RepID=A0A1E2SKI3_LEIXY|nr:hypothetical protein ATY41_01640 [Leifsonia xyli subsp. xyli]
MSERSFDRREQAGGCGAGNGQEDRAGKRADSSAVGEFGGCVGGANTVQAGEDRTAIRAESHEVAGRGGTGPAGRAEVGEGTGDTDENGRSGTGRKCWALFEKGSERPARGVLDEDSRDGPPAGAVRRELTEDTSDVFGTGLTAGTDVGERNAGVSESAVIRQRPGILRPDPKHSRLREVIADHEDRTLARRVVGKLPARREPEQGPPMPLRDESGLACEVDRAPAGRSGSPRLLWPW